MTDIVQRLRDSAAQARALDRAALLNEAAGEIEKLRQRLRLADAALRSDSPTLTDAEREALWFAIAYAQNAGHGCEATLRGLMERMQ